MTAVLTASSLSAGYRHGRRTHAVLRDLDVELEPGTFTCLLGPNGSGKSTLLRTLAGMQAPLKGEVRLLGDPVHRLSVTERARRSAVVLTDPVDAGLLHVRDLVALGRYPHTGLSGRLRAADHAAVASALDATGAAALADRPFAELSDGERQRVLVARALAQDPAVLMLDEPVAFIDVARRVEIVQLVRRLVRERSLAVLLTTHDLDLALRSADVLWLLEPVSGGPSRLLVGGPEDLALSGAVGRVFDSAQVRFDLAKATFVPAPTSDLRAHVIGTGAAAVWTARALERAGITVTDDGAASPVALSVEVGDGIWTLRAPGPPQRCHSIADLVELLRPLFEPQPAPAPAPAGSVE